MCANGNTESAGAPLEPASETRSKARPAGCRPSLMLVNVVAVSLEPRRGCGEMGENSAAKRGVSDARTLRGAGGFLRCGGGEDARSGEAR